MVKLIPIVPFVVVFTSKGEVGVAVPIPTELVVEVIVPLVVHWAFASVEKLKKRESDTMSFFMI